MFILKDCEKISIVTNEEDLLKNKEKISILYNQKLYDSISFECISDPSQRKLRPNLRNQFDENKEEALKKLHKLSLRIVGKSKKDSPSDGNETVVLKKFDAITVVTTKKDLLENTEKISVLFQDKLYDPFTYKCLSHPSEKNIHKNILKEFKENLDDIYAAFGSMANGSDDVALLPASQPVPIQQERGKFADKLEEMMLKVLAEQSVDKVLDLAKPMLEKHIIDTFGILPQVHEIKTPASTHKIEGVVHEKFDEILNLVNLKIPVYLSGEAGTGKNVICQQIAEALGLEFYFTNAVTQEYQLKGFTDANGRYHETQFFKAFKNGGLFFLDEMDGSIPEALIILNSAIANGYFDFPAPIGKIHAHENFRIVSAGNTIGTGADIEYTGRFQLDASSLDRFALLKIDYSPKIEEAITNGNNELCEFARTFRKATTASSIRCLFSYRSLDRITKLESLYHLPEVLKMSLTKGLGKDDLRIICKKFDDMQFNNKYTQALKKVKVD